MRDAFGGAFMIKLMLVFLVLYVCFIAIALNYAKAFKAKNGIIDYLERYEGYNTATETLINLYLDSINYNVPITVNSGGSYINTENGRCFSRGYCIENYNDASGSNYIVTTYMKVTLLGFDSLAGLSFTVPIRGEVRIPYFNN